MSYFDTTQVVIFTNLHTILQITSCSGRVLHILICANLHSTHAWGGMKRLLYWEATKYFQDDQDLAVFSCRSLYVQACVYVPVFVCVCQYRDFLSAGKINILWGQSSRTRSLSIEPTGFNPGREQPRLWTCVRIFAFISLQFNSWSLTIEFTIQHNFCFNSLKTSLYFFIGHLII